MKVLLIILLLAGMLESAYAQAGSPGNATTQPASASPQVAPKPEKPRSRMLKKNGSRPGPAATVSERPTVAPMPTIAPRNSRKAGHGSRKQEQPPVMNYAEATQRHHHERHDQAWWRSHFTTIVFVTGSGYYFWDAGYWFPAYGYDPRYEAFEYNGPIYTYGNLLPDQVIYNVQRALKDLGYYSGALTGSLSSATIAALTLFQEDNGLYITGAIDQPTVEALGLY